PTSTRPSTRHAPDAAAYRPIHGTGLQYQLISDAICCELQSWQLSRTPNVGVQNMSSNESKPRPSRRTVLKLAGVGAGAAMLSRASRVSADRRAPELHTRFSREFGLRVPLASAGMAFVGLTDLTSAV